MSKNKVKKSPAAAAAGETENLEIGYSCPTGKVIYSKLY
jgi:hypothetical protein